MLILEFERAENQVALVANDHGAINVDDGDLDIDGPTHPDRVADERLEERALYDLIGEELVFADLWAPGLAGSRWASHVWRRQRAAQRIEEPGEEF